MIQLPTIPISSKLLKIEENIASTVDNFTCSTLVSICLKISSNAKLEKNKSF